MTTKQGANSKIEEVAKTANIVAETNINIVTLEDGRTVDIHVCKARNTGVVLRGALDIMKEMGIKNLGEVPKINIADPSFFLQLIAKSADTLYEVAAELCSLEHEEILDLDIDDAILVILQVVNVNKVFFLEKVMPRLQNVLPKSPAPKKKPVRRKR